MTEIIEKELTAEEIAEREEWVAGAYDREIEAIRQMRLQAYELTADPLFFKWQAGEGTEQEWKDARAAVVEAYPYPEPPKK